MPPGTFQGATNISEINLGRGTSWNVLSTIGTQIMHVNGGRIAAVKAPKCLIYIGLAGLFQMPATANLIFLLM